MFKRSKHHLVESEHTYWSHFKIAVFNGLDIMWVGFASVLHGIFPNMYAFYAEKRIEEYYEITQQIRQRRLDLMEKRKKNE